MSKFIHSIKVPAIFAVLIPAVNNMLLHPLMNRFPFLSRFVVGASWLTTAVLSASVFVVGVVLQYAKNKFNHFKNNAIAEYANKDERAISLLSDEERLAFQRGVDASQSTKALMQGSVA